MTEPHFKPWKGNLYGRGSQFGLGVMVLGESHYLGGPSVDSPEFTTEVISEVSCGSDNQWERRLPFFAKVFRAFTKKARAQADGVEWKGFWDSLLFYNYIQEPVGTTSRIRPTLEMWDNAPQPLRHVLTTYRPDCVLVLGYGTWGHLHAVKLACGADPSRHQQCCVQLDEPARIPIAGICHPSSSRFDHEVSGKTVDDLLERARFQLASGGGNGIVLV